MLCLTATQRALAFIIVKERVDIECATCIKTTDRHDNIFQYLKGITTIFYFVRDYNIHDDAFY